MEFANLETRVHRTSLNIPYGYEDIANTHRVASVSRHLIVLAKGCKF
jgi:hypothetical protein